MNVVVIVAHPDDETIWCGGLILRHPQWHWSALSLCRGDDPDRAPKFLRVCRELGVTGFISDLDDSHPLKDIDPEREIAVRIRKSLPQAHWDLCITHGTNGEYGHRRHKEVHAEVVRLARAGALYCYELRTFAYKCGASGTCRPAPWADMTVDLSEVELAAKKLAITKAYGYAEDSFEAKACISPECFEVLCRPLEGQCHEGACTL